MMSSYHKKWSLSPERVDLVRSGCRLEPSGSSCGVALCWGRCEETQSDCSTQLDTLSVATQQAAADLTLWSDTDSCLLLEKGLVTQQAGPGGCFLMRRKVNQWVGNKGASLGGERGGVIASEKRIVGENGFESELWCLLWTVHRGDQVGWNGHNEKGYWVEWRGDIVSSQ